jgi:hypothetical protein
MGQVDGCTQHTRGAGCIHSSGAMHMAGCIFFCSSHQSRILWKGIVFPALLAMPYGSLLLWKANQGNLPHVFLPDSAAKSGKWRMRRGENYCCFMRPKCVWMLRECAARLRLLSRRREKFNFGPRREKNVIIGMRCDDMRAVRRLRFCKRALLISSMLVRETMCCAARRAEGCLSHTVAAFEKFALYHFLTTSNYKKLWK